MLRHVGVKMVHPFARMPEKATIGSAGFDVRSCENVLLASRDRMGGVYQISTGLKFDLPLGWEIQVRPRSGLSRSGIMLVNSPGTIDSDYRGELYVLLENRSSVEFEVEVGMRIAQIVFKQVPDIELYRVDEISDTERGNGRFGSTGLK
jgi:dUTP pyrophosphatase